MHSSFEILYCTAQHAADEASYRRDGRLLLIAMIGTMMLLPAMLLAATYGEAMATQAFATVFASTFASLVLGYATPRLNREEQDRLCEAFAECRMLSAKTTSQLTNVITRGTAAAIVELLNAELREPQPLRAVATR